MKPVNTSVMTQAEYEALPPSIQRKCFSPLERMRIAEHSTSRQSRASSITYASSRSSSRSGHRAHSFDGHSRPGTSSGPRMWKLRALRSDNGIEITQADAQWYLSLPEKVRRRLFSLQEQHALGSRCGDVIGQRILAKPPRWGSRRDSTVSGRSVSATSAPPGTPASIESLLDRFDITADELVHDDFDDGSLQSQYESSHGRPSKKTSPRSRSASAGSTSFPHPLLSPTPNVTSPPFRTFSAESQPSQRVLGFQRKPSRSAMAGMTIDTAAAAERKPIYYQDPEARAKVKQYLVSPSKFDEVVEFGFPTIPEAAPLQTKTSHVHFHPGMPHVSADVQRFCSRETPYPTTEEHEAPNHAGDDDDLSSIADSDGPGTPLDTDALSHYPGRPFSSPTGPFLTRAPSRSSPQRDLATVAQSLAPSNREMTLKLTLTRPDLRNSQEDGAKWVTQREYVGQAQPMRNADPLALEPLALTDDVTGACGAFAVQPGKADGGFVQKMRSLIKKSSK